MRLDLIHRHETVAIGRGVADGRTDVGAGQAAAVAALPGHVVELIATGIPVAWLAAVAGHDRIAAVLEDVIVQPHAVAHAGVHAAIEDAVEVVVVDMRLSEAQQRGTRIDVVEMIEGESNPAIIVAAVAVAPE